MGESFLEQSIFPDFLPLPSHCFCESSKSNKFLVCVWGGGGGGRGGGGGWGEGWCWVLQEKKYGSWAGTELEFGFLAGKHRVN